MKPSRQMHDLLDNGTKKKPKHSHENTSTNSHIYLDSSSQLTLFGPLSSRFDFKIISKIISYLDIKNVVTTEKINKEWNKFLQPIITFPALFSAMAISTYFAMRTSLIFEDESYTYQALNQKVNRLSQYLLDFCNRQQKSKESKIAVFLDASSDAIITMLAIMKAGFVYVPLVADDDIAINKLIQIIDDCKPILTITHSKFINHPFVKHSLATQHTIFYFDKEQALLNQFSANLSVVTINASDAAYLLYTSGSTGTSKGVLVEHAGLYNRFLSHKRLLQITPQDKIALFASLGFDASIMEIMMALLSGATLYIVPTQIRLNILELGEYYLKNAITIAIFTPSMLRILNPRDFSHMRVIISTGEPIDKDTFAKWYWRDEANTKPRLFINGYGPVEATICTTLGVCTPETGLHIGNAIEGVEILVLEENPTDVKKPKRVKEGERGELYITGIGIARSYYGNSKLITDLNTRKFLTILHPDDHHKRIEQQRYIRVYRTNDAMRLHNGKLEFLERLDRQVKIYGKLVAPEEIDAALKKDSLIEDAYVDISTNDYGHPNITAYLIVKDLYQLPDLTELYQNVAKSLNKNMCPSRWAFISKQQLSLSLNHNGKLDRHKLENNPLIQYLRLQADQIVEASDPVEKELVELWANELKILDNNFKYSIDTDFFVLGGTSIQAASFIANVNIKFPKLKLTPTIFYRNPSISSIARKIRRLEIRAKLLPHTPEYYFPVVSLLEERFTLKQYQAGAQIPLFLIHSALGNPNEDYLKLIEQWKSERPIYGIEARGLQDAKDMDNTLEELALDYVQAITRVQPQGPYLIAGWSAGGIIAAAIAHFFRLKNVDVATLVIDSMHPSIIKNMPHNEFTEYFLSIIQKATLPRLGIKNLDINKEKLHQLSKDGQIKLIIQACFQQSKALPEYTCRLLSTIQSTIEAISHSVMSLADKNITLCITSHSQDKFGRLLGWGSVPHAEIINGDHFSIFEYIPFVKHVSDKIIAFCDQNEKKYNEQSLRKQNSSLDIDADCYLSDFQAQLKYKYQQCKIKRIFGPPLSISECFVNLTIVSSPLYNHYKQNNPKQLVNLSDLEKDYEDLFRTTAKKAIAPERLFNIQNDNKPPKRILIKGYAGIGKSTLCDYICAYLWAVMNVWSSLFDLIITIKLRNLTKDKYTSNLKLVDIIEMECLDRSGLTRTLDKVSIAKIIQAKANKILVILDGWDEFDQKKSPCARIIFDMLANPHLSIIILTRPFVNIDRKGFDLELECIGFTDANIKNYITKVSKDNKSADETYQFLQKNSALHYLAHIPIILDFICIIFHEEQLNLNQKISISEIYHKIIVKLWRSYIEKQEESFAEIDSIQLQNKKENAKKFLQLLAFLAMHNNKIIFSYALIEKALKMVFQTQDEDLDCKLKELLESGFLHASDSDYKRGTFNFPHMTIQAHFAAQYFVELFVINPNKAISFLTENKYNPPLEMMWWFVAGILGKSAVTDDTYKQHLINYFKILSNTPTSLNKRHHIYLLMRCYDESGMTIDLDHDDSLLQKIRPYIQQLFTDKSDNKDELLYYLQICSFEFKEKCGLINDIIYHLNSDDIFTAVFLVRKLQLNHPVIIEHLKKAYFSKKSSWHDGAISLLIELKISDLSFIEALIEQVKSGEYDEISNLLKLGYRAEWFEPFLVNALENIQLPPDTRFKAAKLLIELGVRDQGVIKNLLDIHNEQEKLSHELKVLSFDNAPLSIITTQEDEHVQVLSALALAELHVVDEEVVKTLLHLRGDYTDCMGEVIEILSKWNMRDEWFVDLLIEAFESGNSDTEEMVTQILENLKIYDAWFINIMREWLFSDDDSKKEAARSIFIGIEFEEPWFIEYLYNLLKIDEDKVTQVVNIVNSDSDDHESAESSKQVADNKFIIKFLCKSKILDNDPIHIKKIIYYFLNRNITVPKAFIKMLSRLKDQQWYIDLVQYFLANPDVNFKYNFVSLLLKASVPIDLYKSVVFELLNKSSTKINMMLKLAEANICDEWFISFVRAALLDKDATIKVISAKILIDMGMVENFMFELLLRSLNDHVRQYHFYVPSYLERLQDSLPHKIIANYFVKMAEAGIHSAQENLLQRMSISFVYECFLLDSIYENKSIYIKTILQLIIKNKSLAYWKSDSVLVCYNNRVRAEMEVDEVFYRLFCEAYQKCSLNIIPQHPNDQEKPAVLNNESFAVGYGSDNESLIVQLYHALKTKRPVKAEEVNDEITEPQSKKAKECAEHGIFKTSSDQYENKLSPNGALNESMTKRM